MKLNEDFVSSLMKESLNEISSDLNLKEISKSFFIDNHAWDVEQDFDDVMVTGQGFIDVEGAQVPLILTNYGETITVDKELIPGEVDFVNLSEDEVEEWITKYEDFDWSSVEEILISDHSDEVDDAIMDALQDEKETREYRRDPYSFYGVRRSDF